MVDLGASQSSGAITLTNVGGQGLTWSLGGSASPFGVSNTGGILGPGTSTTIDVTIDRSGLAEGAHSATVQISDAIGPTPVGLRASVERPPTFSRASTSTSCLTTGSGQVLVIGFQVAIADESPISSATWSVSGPSGQNVSEALVQDGPLWFAAANVPYRSASTVNGVWSWTATATDSRGNVGTTSGSTRVGC